MIAGLWDESQNGDGDGQPAKITVGYMASEYPAISHTFILREIQALRARGVEVHTISIHPPEHRMNDEEAREEKNTHYVRRVPLTTLIWGSARRTVLHPAAAWRMLRHGFQARRQARHGIVMLAACYVQAVALLDWAERAGVRHVHVHFANPASTVAMMAAASGGIEFSVSVHGPDVFYDVDGNLLAEKVRRARFVRCISHYCRSQLMRVSAHQDWNKLHLVRCGIDTDVFSSRPNPKNSATNIVCVGRLVPAKAQHLLLAACKTLRDRGHQFQLTLIGDGPHRESLKELASKCGLEQCAIFTLGVTPQQVNEHLNNADIMALPSFAEGLPVVLMEAMAKEVPCVSTRIMGIPELIEHDVNGLLTAPSDIDSLVAQIERLLNDPELRMDFGREARKKVVAEFHINQTAELMHSLFSTYAGTPQK